MRFVRLLWITSRPGGAWVGSVSNKHNPSKKLGLGACISSRITTVIHVMNDHQINYNCFNEPFAVSPYRSLYWDMHGLIFETSIWLLAGSTRCVLHHRQHMRQWTSVPPSGSQQSVILSSHARKPSTSDGYRTLSELAPWHSQAKHNGELQRFPKVLSLRGFA